MPVLAALLPPLIAVCCSFLFLITIQNQLCNPKLFRVDYMGRHKPIPGGSTATAAVQAADAHIINTKRNPPQAGRLRICSNHVFISRFRTH
ncbi:hypothetical protein UWK_02388 [Desulfocapsa sulfexigens DSM 10523]|uniref:Uncharacterized protein n=1 Tax=Desulfocapsa sulfexigens (strain DSM 10523 / SB164P1) TaxID=1167006 RepID=M1P646_DESSD|nr:hypothetical protein UWK_02388 [Desulfocapsa sulfexigens DSM 10523]